MATKDLVLSKEYLKQLYSKDFPLWAEINLELLKEKAYELVDWENLLEEIEDMSLRHLESCISYLAVILEHMYKWDNFKHLAGGDTAGNSWKRSIANSRDEIEAMFKNYPSLRAKLPNEVDRAWNFAVAKLRSWLRKNNLNPEDFQIPDKCPYTYEQALNRQL